MGSPPEPADLPEEAFTEVAEALSLELDANEAADGKTRHVS
jgi:hypothetical protein